MFQVATVVRHWPRACRLPTAWRFPRGRMMAATSGVWFVWLVIAGVAMPVGGGSNATAAEPARPPNVVLVLADDLGFADLGCYGSEIETPHLDRLAARGLRFSQFYNTARCWPSRAALMTGLYPHQAGIAMNFGAAAPFGYRGLVPKSARMIPELLAAKGYRSYHVGKWHLNRGGEHNDTFPLGRGFQRSLFVGDHDNYFAPKMLLEDRTRLPVPEPGYYLTDAMGETAVRHLQVHAAQAKDAPFFLYLAFTAPHFPLHAKADDVARLIGRYREGWDATRVARHRRQKELGLVRCDLSPRDPEAKAWDTLSDAEQTEWDARMATYAAMIVALDRAVGTVVKQVEAMRALDDTLILFLSDNGSSAEFLVRGEGHDPAAPPGSRKTFRCLEVGWSNAANTPFREHKMWVHEGGISTPLIAHWPNGIKARGDVSHQPGHLIDILPTLIDLAGVEYPKEFEGQPTTMPPGQSLASMLRGGAAVTSRTLFWEHLGNRALRQGDWKIVAEHGKPWALYDLATDRAELRDQAAEQPERTKQMTAEWDARAKQYGVVDWDTFPQSKGKPRPDYRRK